MVNGCDPYKQCRTDTTHHEPHEVCVVPRSNTGAHPYTVVIELRYAVIAVVTVATILGSEDVTSFAVFSARHTVPVLGPIEDSTLFGGNICVPSVESLLRHWGNVGRWDYAWVAHSCGEKEESC